MGNVQAVLIDTMSIQHYIFGSNKLKENIGASELVKRLYGTFLEQAIDETLGISKKNFDFQKWKTHPQDVFKQSSEFDIGYIGGGNALLLFQGDHALEYARTFGSIWSRLLLVQTPGVVPAFVCGEIELAEDRFHHSKNALFDMLDAHKASYIPQTRLPGYGITAQCSRSGLTIDIDAASQELISSESKAKIGAASGATEALNKQFADVLGDTYRFTDQLEQLGQHKHEDSHIAIVHIDGNNMGELFQKYPKTLSETRKLSKDVAAATEAAFTTLLWKIKNDFNEMTAEDINIFWAHDRKSAYLPLRPIIIGGDDITFVCDGRVGIYFAQIFLNAFKKSCEKLKLLDPDSFREESPHYATACAGIAVTKTKYPFFRGYTLAEGLCKSAKEARSEAKNTGSWLDFHIAYGGFTATDLKSIRDEHYQAPQGKLLTRPYQVDAKSGTESFPALIAQTAKLKYKKDLHLNFPNLKLKALRDVLTQGEHATATFIQEQAVRGRTLPLQDVYPGEKLFFEGRTAYLDMIELLEMYPDYVLRQRRKEGDA